MPSERPDDGAEARRLHPLSLVFIIGSLAWSMLLPGIFVLFVASKGGNAEFWIMVAFVPAVIGSLAKYWSYRYRLDRDELVIREGIVFRNERHIPYGRIQNIDHVQNPLHRMFGVAEVRLETAAGDKPEATMRVLSLAAVDRMRSRVFSGRRPSDVPPLAGPEAEPVVAGSDGSLLHGMPLREVVLFGLISNKGMVVVAAAMGLLWQTDMSRFWGDEVSQNTLRRLLGWLPGDFLAVASLVLTGLVVLVVLMRVLSVAWAIVTLYDFRLQRHGDDLRAEYGLWSRVSKTIPRHRIQVVSTRQGFLHRLARRVAVQVETAGGGGDKSSDRLWLAPLIEQDRVASLLREALPEVDLRSLHWQSISAGTFRRLLRVGLFWAAALTLVAVVGLGAWGLIVPAVLVPMAWTNARLYVGHTAWVSAPGAVFFRSGWWVRRMSVARHSKIQSVQVTESLFDRRHGTASLQVDTAGATRVGHGIDVSYLDAPVAAALMGRLAAAAERTAFRW